MTNKEFFLKTIEAERPVFINVIKAIPQDKLGFKPHEKARTTESLAAQLVSQPLFVSVVAKTGVADLSGYKNPENPKVEDMVASMENNFAELKKDVAAVSDADWENGAAIMAFPGGKWETKKYDMAWGFLFDAIHHRGQLSTYLRVMGAKVPSIYGGSADERPSA